MDIKLLTLMLSTLASVSSFAAHIVTDTRDGNTLVKRTHTYANSAGDLRIEEQGFASSSTMSAEGSTNSKPNVTHTPGQIEDIIIYQSRDKAVVILEGSICRKLSANSAPPPGLAAMGGDMGAAQQQMAEAMKQASAQMEQAMAEARKQGMTAEQEKMMRQFTNPAMNINKVKPRGALTITALDQTVKVAGLTGEGYLVSDTEGTEKFRIWVAPVDKIEGASHVRKGLEGMMTTFEQYLDKIGGSALIDTGLSAMFNKDEMKNRYPIRTEDLQSGEVTDIVKVSGDEGDIDYYPKCEERDMMGN